MFAPGEQDKVSRYSVAYQVRPSEDSPMKRLAGSTVIPGVGERGKDSTLNAVEWETGSILATRRGEIKLNSKGGGGNPGEAKYLLCY